MKKIFLFCLFLLFLPSCGSITQKGYYFNDNIYAIKEGITHKNNVVTLIGEPYFEFKENNSWLYYSYTIKKYNLIKQKLVGEKILILTFDDSEIVSKKIYKEIEGQSINFNDFNKKSEKEKINFLKELFYDVQPVVAQ